MRPVKVRPVGHSSQSQRYPKDGNLGPLPKISGSGANGKVKDLEYRHSGNGTKEMEDENDDRWPITSARLTLVIIVAKHFRVSGCAVVWLVTFT